MSYNPCSVCGQPWGCIGETVYACACPGGPPEAKTCMTTSPNSSAEAWRKERWLWLRRWKHGDAFADFGGTWSIYDAHGSLVALGSVDVAVSAMEAADLAIAEMERKG